MATYATTAQLAEAVGLKASVPSWDIGSSPSLETVGTGDGSNAVFYLDHQNILSGSQIIYYGATAAAAVALTETTHYTLDLTKGKITLTTAGKTLVSTNNIYAEYNYVTIGMSDAYLATVISRAQTQVDNDVGSTFTDGTATNPAYPSKVETQQTKGLYDREYVTRQRPVIDVHSTLSADITAVVTSIALASGDGSSFPTSGTVIIGTEIITYTGITTDTLTGCTRGANSSTAATHSSGDEVHTTIVEISGTEEGGTPTFYAQEWNKDMYLDEDNFIQIYNETPLNSTPLLDNDLMSTPGVFNRIKLTYLYGYDRIGADITRLTLIFAKRILMNDNISKSMIAGRNEFNPEMLNADEDEIESIVSEYKLLQATNT